MLWEQTLKNILADGRTKLFELGPNSQIKSMTKRVSMDAWKTFQNVDVNERMNKTTTPRALERRIPSQYMNDI